MWHAHMPQVLLHDKTQQLCVARNQDSASARGQLLLELPSWVLLCLCWTCWLPQAARHPGQDEQSLTGSMSCCSSWSRGSCSSMFQPLPTQPLHLSRPPLLKMWPPSEHQASPELWQSAAMCRIFVTWCHVPCFRVT